jgi:lipoprotein-anchoring transpeptidase ErfK/SrfK
MSAKKRRKGHLGLILLLVFVAAAGAAAASYAVYAEQYTEKFIEGTIINGTNVGNMTAEEVEDTIKSRVETYEVTLKFDEGKEEKISGDEIGLKYQSDGQVEKILADQDKYAWIEGKLFGNQKDFTVGEAYTYDKAAVQKVVEALPEFQPENQVAPRDAYMKMNTDAGKLEIVPEVDGNQLIPEVVCKALDQAIEDGDKSLDVTALEGVYARPKVTSQDEALNLQVNDLNGFLDTTVTLNHYKGGTAVIDRNTTKTWLSTRENDPNYWYINTDLLKQKVAEYVAGFAAADDEVHNTAKFHSQNKGDLELKSPAYGHQVDQKAETEAIYTDLTTKKTETRTPVYSLNKQGGGFGDTFVEIDLDAQHVYVHQGDQVVFDSACVSGLASDPERITPKGVYKIFLHTTDRDLKGKINPATGKPSYVSHVNFWMPFNGGVGMHDASWRSEFGGQIYKTSGSHGCVNLPYEAAQKIYNLVNVGTYVIVL